MQTRSYGAEPDVPAGRRRGLDAEQVVARVTCYAFDPRVLAEAYGDHGPDSFKRWQEQRAAAESMRRGGTVTAEPVTSFLDDPREVRRCEAAGLAARVAAAMWNRPDGAR